MTTHSNLPAPEQGLLITHFLTVRDVETSRRFYADIFGGEVVMDENPAMVKVANSWIIMNPGGGPTPDKPGITLEAPQDTQRVSSFLNVRVADIASFYAEAVAKGAHFLTEPLDHRLPRWHRVHPVAAPRRPHPAATGRPVAVPDHPRPPS